LSKLRDTLYRQPKTGIQSFILDTYVTPIQETYSEACMRVFIYLTHSCSLYLHKLNQ